MWHHHPQVNKLEELWKTRPAAGVDDLDGNANGTAAGEAGAVQPVALKYDDSAQYQVGRGQGVRAASHGLAHGGRRVEGGK